MTSSIEATAGDRAALKRTRTRPVKPPTLAVIGLGHVGLPTALGFAELGWEVVGADCDAEKANQIAGGQSPFFEPRLDDMLRRHLASGRFRVLRTVQDAVDEGKVLFVCVGTPQRTDGSADLSQVEAVARTIGRGLNGYKLIVEKSTSPVRTAEQIKRTIARYCNGNREFDVAVNPEFLREGTACADFFNPDRIVLGVESEHARSLLLEIYRPLLDRLSHRVGVGATNNGHVVVTDLKTAELIKQASNAFLATKISFINLMSDLCEATGADVGEVAHGLGLDPRIGAAFLRAGAGFGGYCLPKDLRTLIRVGEDHGVDVALLRAVDHINESRAERILKKVHQALWIIGGKTVGILGLAFKPGTDDIREAPSLKIISRLLEEGARLQVHDPKAIGNVTRHFSADTQGLVYCDSPYDAAHGANALLVLTEWDEYRALDLVRIRRLMDTPILIDARNLYEPALMRGHGFEYSSVGRP